MSEHPRNHSDQLTLASTQYFDFWDSRSFFDRMLSRGEVVIPLG